HRDGRRRIDHGVGFGLLSHQALSRDVSGAAFIVCRNLVKRFRGRAVLDGLSLEVRAGETLVILGGSGSGKSVLLKHMNGLLRPDAGEVLVDGERLTPLSEDELTRVRRKVG